jgi:restriction system protein
MELLSRLPWWCGVLLALLTYVVLSRVAEIPIGRSDGPGSGIAHLVWKTFASVGQYVLPMLCLAGAAASAVRAHRATQLLNSVVASDSAASLDGMGWRQFEQLVGEAFRIDGYAVVDTGGAGPDGGVDLLLKRDGETFLVQCKHWRALKVGVQVIRELYGVMAARGAAGGFVVTSGRFTAEAVGFAAGRNLVLIDGPALQAMIRRVRSTHLPVSAAARTPAAPAPAPGGDAAGPPSCASCGRAMVQRTARRGSNAGNRFWGCTGYPSCRETRAVG